MILLWRINQILKTKEQIYSIINKISTQQSIIYYDYKLDHNWQVKRYSCPVLRLVVASHQ